VARGGEVIRTQPPLPIVYVESHCDNIRVISLRYITDIILISLWWCISDLTTGGKSQGQFLHESAEGVDCGLTVGQFVRRRFEKQLNCCEDLQLKTGSTTAARALRVDDRAAQARSGSAPFRAEARPDGATADTRWGRGTVAPAAASKAEPSPLAR
jgi:hypothetical protein